MSLMDFLKAPLGVPVEKRFVSIFLPRERVDIDYDDTAIVPDTAYCRVYLSTLRFALDSQFASARLPVIHTMTRFDYGGRNHDVPYLAGLGRLTELTKVGHDWLSTMNEPLTPLFPFKRGSIEFQAGTYSVPSTEAFKRFVSTMERMANLLAVPELSSVLRLAGPVSSGIDDLLSLDEIRMELGYRQTFLADGGTENTLRAGYFAVIMGELSRLNSETLCVINGDLHIGSPGTNREFLDDHQPLSITLSVQEELGVTEP